MFFIFARVKLKTTGLFHPRKISNILVFFWQELSIIVTYKNEISLFMIRLMIHNPISPVNLFQQNHLHQLMRKRHS